MNNENDKYAELINQIKVLQVKLPDSQRLTSKIMDNIELLSKRKTYIKVLNVIIITSSIAASLLIGLFVFEQFLIPNNLEHKKIHIVSTCTSTTYDKNASIEKQTTLTAFNSLIQLKKERQKKQQAFNSIINKYKIL